MRIKKRIKLIVTITLSTFFMQACVMDRVYYFRLKNDADYSITVLELHKFQLQALEHKYADTTLPQVAEFYPWNVADTGRYAIAWEESHKLETIMERESVDTICIFVFKTEDLHSYDWDSIRSHYHILQRYDLSTGDVGSFNNVLCFPPSEAMKHIHMWPPYGTYDENGNQK